MLRRRVRVTGRVQGVGFRYSCAQQADRQGVAGWVMNLADGSVEAVFEGSEDRVDALVDWCRRGPLAASVRGVEVSQEPPRGERGFSVR